MWSYLFNFDHLMWLSLYLTFVTSHLLTCLPEWDNTCVKDSDCCSNNCWRGASNWATGVCKNGTGENNGNGTGTGTGTTTGGSTPLDCQIGQCGRGICSWYGDSQESPPGSLTSCGTQMNTAALTAAQLENLLPQLPCNTIVRVTNEDNGKTVDVRLDNTGGGGPGRIIDLSWAAFGVIEERNKGLTPCSYQVIKMGSGKPWPFVEMVQFWRHFPSTLYFKPGPVRFSGPGWTFPPEVTEPTDSVGSVTSSDSVESELPNRN